MEEMELERVIMRDEKGEERVAEILKIVEIGDKNYAVYTFDPEAENVDLYTALVVENEGQIDFRPVDSEEDINTIKSEINSLMM